MTTSCFIKITIMVMFLSAIISSKEEKIIKYYNKNISVIEFIEASQYPIIIKKSFLQNYISRLNSWIFSSISYPNSLTLGSFCIPLYR